MKTNIHFSSYLSHFFLEREVFQTEIVQEIITHFMFSNFFYPENRAVCEIVWKHIVEGDWPQMTAWCMCIACWLIKPIKTHSECVILIAFPLQQWLHERASVISLCVRCVSCIVGIQFIFFFISNCISGSYLRIRNICNTSHIYIEIVKLVVRCLKPNFWRIVKNRFAYGPGVTFSLACKT